MCGLKVQTHLLHPPYLQRQGQVLWLSYVHLVAVSQEILELELFVHSSQICMCVSLYQ